MKCIFCTTWDSYVEHIAQLMDTYVILKIIQQEGIKQILFNNPKMKLKYYLTIFAEPKVNKIMFQFDCLNKCFWILL